MSKENSKNTAQKDKALQKNRKYKNAVIGLTVAVSILGATTAGLGIAYGITQSQASVYSTQLENTYQKNYYELVDNVNSADVKMSKLINAQSPTYQKKLLMEVSDTAKSMQNNISNLPLTGENVLENVSFINQLAGYTSTLQDKISNGQNLTESDLLTIEELHYSLMTMKENLNKMSANMNNGYSILEASSRMDGDVSAFSVDFAKIKATDMDYPTMIYDGPFSDSVVNAKIEGLDGSNITREKAHKVIDTTFKDVSSIKYNSETKGKFETFNFNLNTSDNQNLYVQVTKKGGNILSVSGQTNTDTKNIDMATAEKIALKFVEDNGIENVKCVWSDELKNEAYLNIAPVQDGIILYPDLIKVKVDMQYGNVIGYDAVSYFTNHKDRALGNATASKSIAKAQVPEEYTVKSYALVLAPLDYNREVLCYEFACEKDNIEYYFYYNAQTGEQENILKVVKTSDGSKLM